MTSFLKLKCLIFTGACNIADSIDVLILCKFLIHFNLIIIVQCLSPYIVESFCTEYLCTTSFCTASSCMESSCIECSYQAIHCGSTINSIIKIYQNPKCWVFYPLPWAQCTSHSLERGGKPVAWLLKSWLPVGFSPIPQYLLKLYK